MKTNKKRYKYTKNQKDNKSRSVIELQANINRKISAVLKYIGIKNISPFSLLFLNISNNFLMI